MSIRNDNVSNSGRALDSATGDGGSSRRRGEHLVGAILDAAWDELKAGGLGGFTMERAAAKARTSRAVLYRRWPDRIDLAIAAIGHHLANNPVDVPDMGSVRDELFMLARKSLDRGMPEVFKLLMHLQDDGIPPNDLRARVLGNEQGLLDGIMRRAVARHEIDPAKLTERRKTVVIDVLRHDLLMSQSSIADEAIYSAIDELFLPLVRP